MCRAQGKRERGRGRRSNSIHNFTTRNLIQLGLYRGSFYEQPARKQQVSWPQSCSVFRLISSNSSASSSASQGGCKFSLSLSLSMPQQSNQINFMPCLLQFYGISNAASAAGRSRPRPQHTGSGCCVGNWQQREVQVELELERQQELTQGEGKEEADDYLV